MCERNECQSAKILGSLRDRIYAIMDEEGVCPLCQGRDTHWDKCVFAEGEKVIGGSPGLVNMPAHG